MWSENSKWVLVPGASENPDPAIEVSPNRWMLLSFAREQHVIVSAWVSEQTDQWNILVSIPDPQRVEKVLESRAKLKEAALLRQEVLWERERRKNRKHQNDNIETIEKEKENGTGTNQHGDRRSSDGRQDGQPKPAGAKSTAGCLLITPNGQEWF